MIIVKNRILFFCITGLIVLASLVSTLLWGLKLSTDFTGGTLVEVTYPNGRPSVADLSAALDKVGFKGYSIREAGDKDYILRSPELSADQRTALPLILSMGSTTDSQITQYTQVGPTIGTELRRKAFISISLVLLCILLFIAFAFRKVSQPVSSWVYGLIALVTLLHDVIVPVGFFAALGHFAGAEVDTLFVTAVLTVLGFSVHDTIVVFDRVRENLAINKEKGRKEPFEETAGRALNQTFVRSVNTSFTVLLTLLVLYFIGPASTKWFALTLLVGIIAGTYSSIALATPLLVESERWFKKGKK
jgi:preprotein translocase subunit SecF